MGTIRDLVGDEVVAVAPDATLMDAARAMADNDVGMVVIGTPADIRGVVSERDIVRAAASGTDFEANKVTEMAASELVWADASASESAVASEMLQEWVRHVLVTEDGTLVGVVSARDLLSAVIEADEGTDQV